MKTNYEKTIATLMVALLTLSPVAVSATSVSNAFQSLGSNGSLSSVVVVGSGAAASDVAGAVDIAVRLATLNYQAVSTSGSPTSGINGIVKNQLDINYGNLTDSSTNSFPNPIRTFHYNGLQTGSISYKGNTYNYHEDFNLNPSGTSAYFSHDYTTSGINGTETLVVPSGSVAYEYVFDTAVNCTALATTAQNTCVVGGTLEYTNPIKITMLGKPFVIVGIGSSQVTMLSGSVGTATATAGVTFGTYTVYSDLGNSGSWARVIVKDANGNTVETATLNQGDSKDFTTEGITVKVTNVRALQDGTVVGTDLVVGSIGSTQITYSASCSVGGTGSSNTNFPGETNWCIQTKSGSFASSGAIAAQDTLQVVFKPSSGTQYFKWAGQTIKLPFPNNYGEVGFEGWNYNSFSTLTFKPTNSGVSAYCSIGGGATNSTVCASNLNGIEVDSDTAGTLVDSSTNTGYSKVFYLFNQSFGGTGYVYPVMVGFWDSVNGRIGVNLTLASGTSNGTYYKLLNSNVWGNASNYFLFNTTVSFGGGAAAKDQYIIVANLSSPTSAGGDQASGGSNAYSLIPTFRIQPSDTSIYQTASTVTSGVTTSMLTTQIGTLINWVNTSLTWSTSSAPQFRLYTSDSTDTKDVQIPNVGSSIPTLQDVGQASQDVVTDGGLTVANPSGAGTNTVVIKAPAQTLNVMAYIGKAGAGTTTTGGTVNQLVPVTTPVAMLDTEVTSAVYSKNMVLVGGPCVNSIVANMAANGTFKYTCSGWPGSNFGYISVADNVYMQGKTVVVIAGTTAPDTRLAADVFQNYDTLLSSYTTQSAVQITGTTTSPSIVPG